jgi:hypothetical protein
MCNPAQIIACRERGLCHLKLIDMFAAIVFIAVVLIFLGKVGTGGGTGWGSRYNEWDDDRGGGRHSSGSNNHNDSYDNGYDDGYEDRD